VIVTEERRLCTIRPGATVCPGRLTFTLHPPGGGSGLRFTRPHQAPSPDGKLAEVRGVLERTAQLTEAQALALRQGGYEVDGWPEREPAPSASKLREVWKLKTTPAEYLRRTPAGPQSDLARELVLAGLGDFNVTEEPAQPEE
jgi:hypothetical protein